MENKDGIECSRCGNKYPQFFKVGEKCRWCFEDKEELEIRHIESRLDPEEVVFVAKQSRFKPGGSYVSPDTIFVTDKRVIIREPSVMGLRETVWVIAYDKLSSITLDNGVMSSTLKIWASGYNGEIDAIPKDKAEKMAEYIKEKIQAARPEPGELVRSNCGTPSSAATPALNCCNCVIAPSFLVGTFSTTVRGQHQIRATLQLLYPMPC